MAQKQAIGEELAGLFGDFASECNNQQFIDKSSPKKEKQVKKSLNDTVMNEDKKEINNDSDIPKEEKPKKSKSKPENKEKPQAKTNDNQTEVKKEPLDKTQHNQEETIEESKEEPNTQLSNKGKNHKTLLIKTRLAAAEERIYTITNMATGEITEIRNSLVLGKSNYAGLTIDDKYVSKEHAKLTNKKSYLYIEDLNSTNGTKLNGKKIKTAEAKKEDILKLATTEFIIGIKGE